MKLHTNNRDNRLREIKIFMRNHGYPDESNALKLYTDEILAIKKLKSPDKVLSGNRLKRVVTDCKERAIAALSLYYHAENLSCKLGFFYIIKNDSYPNYYKLGYAKDAESRLNVYQTYSPMRNFALVKYVAIEDRRQAEKLAIDFLGERMMNEWFYSENIDFDFKAICKHMAITTNTPNRFYARV